MTTKNDQRDETQPLSSAPTSADAILRFCRDESLRKEMGRNGKVRASRYAWESVTPQILSVYQQALEERCS